MNNVSEKQILGNQVDYPQKYMPDILVSVPRILNREICNIDGQNLPFTGMDVWHAYELGFLTNKGLPVIGVLKMVIPAESLFIVESKSFKLYLNSFNMERYGNTVIEGIEILLEIIGKDITTLLNCNVQLNFFDRYDNNLRFDFHDYVVLEKSFNSELIQFNNFTETQELLLSGENDLEAIRVASHLLRSNCKITHQPDWGSVFIYMKGEKLPANESLLKYLVSMRNENHFHEEICEMIYFRLWQLFSPSELMVTSVYTRRGGIDICPIRVSNDKLLPRYLSDFKELSCKLLRQ
jgi:7-cyano-7-deazaguanine reductase